MQISFKPSTSWSVAWPAESAFALHAKRSLTVFAFYANSIGVNNQLTSGQRLRLWREHFELTQVQLSEKSSLSNYKICRIEADETDLRNDDMQALAKAMGISAEKFYGKIPTKKAA